MKRLLILLVGLSLCTLTIVPLTSLRKAKPPAERLGYIPSPEVLYFGSLDHRLFVSELLFFNSIFYYGSLVENQKSRPDYERLYYFLDVATRLNPYNIDCYYFGQAVLTWDAGMAKEMNRLLERGARKRTWDFYLPLFLGFNNFYFLSEYDKAAQYTEMAAKLSPQNSYLITLAARLYYQSDKTDYAIEYLKATYELTKNQAVRKSILVRLEALEKIALLERAVKLYQQKFGKPPTLITELVESGIIKKIPKDPYGGEFYFDQRDGRIKTTSNLANPGGK